MKREYLVIQACSLIVCILLALIFAMLLITGTANMQNIITPLVLLVIAVIGLVILSVLMRIERLLSKGKK